MDPQASTAIADTQAEKKPFSHRPTWIKASQWLVVRQSRRVTRLSSALPWAQEVGLVRTLEYRKLISFMYSMGWFRIVYSQDWVISQFRSCRLPQGSIGCKSLQLGHENDVPLMEPAIPHPRSSPHWSGLPFRCSARPADMGTRPGQNLARVSHDSPGRDDPIRLDASIANSSHARPDTPNRSTSPGARSPTSHRRRPDDRRLSPRPRNRA